jgi:uncharacterized protein
MMLLSRSGSLLAVLTICLGTRAVSAQLPSSASAREPEVFATGIAEVRIPPTYAMLTVAVITRAGTAAEAASQTAAKMASTMNALRQVGLTSEEITTQGYTLEQAYDDGGRRRAGFIARNSLEARINRVDQVGAVIDAAISGGATDISSIVYGAANMEDARREAIANAVKRARTDAALIASAAGGSLGRLISITSSSGTPPVYGQLLSGAVRLTSSMSPPPPTVITPRDLSAAAQASGRWEFVPGPVR